MGVTDVIGVMSALPTISIVVPNYNGAATLGQTLQSLVDQQYPGLEIIVVDGGSTDGSVDIIRQYERHLTWWVSEKDRGQAHAINKGFAHCTGQIVNWLCSDDLLKPGALHRVGALFAQRPEVDVIAGQCHMEHRRPGQVPRTVMHGPVDEGQVTLMPSTDPIAQPSCFWRRRFMDRQPALDESYHFAMDFELWMYFQTRHAVWLVIPDVLSTFVMTGDNKTSTGGWRIYEETRRVYQTYRPEPIPLTFWHRHFRHPLQMVLRRRRHTLQGRCARVLLGAIDWTLTPFYGYWRVRVMDWSGLIDPGP